MIRDLLLGLGELALEGAVARIRAAEPAPPARPGVIETRQRADGVYEAVVR